MIFTSLPHHLYLYLFFSCVSISFPQNPPSPPALSDLLRSSATMARLGRRTFLGIAVVFHLVYIYSIFDIYFVSPIVSGMREYRLEGKEPPAKRLVLFVGLYPTAACQLSF